jgi:VanZ family protein
VIRLLRDWGPALLWAGLIFFVSSRSVVPVPQGLEWDKVAHLAAYTVLGLTLAWGAAGSGMPPYRVIVIGLLYGASDEVHQLYVPGRSFELLDWVADAAGVCLGVALFSLLFSELGAGRRSRI